MENKINSFIEPPLGGIIAVSGFGRKKGVKIKIQKSNRAPHFYKTDGWFENLQGEKIFIFRRGTIGIRRSGQNGIFNSQDFEALFKGELTSMLKGIQEVVIKQPLGELFNTIGKLKGISLVKLWHINIVLQIQKRFQCDRF